MISLNYFGSIMAADDWSSLQSPTRRLVFFFFSLLLGELHKRNFKFAFFASSLELNSTNEQVLKMGLCPRFTAASIHFLMALFGDNKSRDSLEEKTFTIFQVKYCQQMVPLQWRWQTEWQWWCGTTRNDTLMPATKPIWNLWCHTYKEETSAFLSY